MKLLTDHAKKNANRQPNFSFTSASQLDISKKNVPTLMEKQS